jgi:hypothetical protein
MKISELNEWGRIVKGVNTTPDVDTDEIKVQTAKFGNKVDKDGRPPTLSKKVKGSKTNVLFNLGLAEGIILRLERDKHIDVLHIMDTNKKHRVEVRGKKGYESGNYDAQDKLHQVLDRVGKAANISELINGETVSINPNHPQGTRAIRTAQDVLQTEDKFTPMQLALMEGGHSLNEWVCGKCFSEPCKCEKTPGDLFTQLENFADGKKKGKSRPGRVKRAGASCNGSVTALRKRAKNASGEKARMYHWCANMKSGRKKK